MLTLHPTILRAGVSVGAGVEADSGDGEAEGLAVDSRLFGDRSPVRRLGCSFLGGSSVTTLTPAIRLLSPLNCAWLQSSHAITGFGTPRMSRTPSFVIVRR